MVTALLAWGCTKSVVPVGPLGMACEGRTLITVDTEPWAPRAVMTVDGVTHGATAVVASLPDVLEIQIGPHTCKIPPLQPGGETGLCDGVGVALHYTPLCETTPVRVRVDAALPVVVDTRDATVSAVETFPFASTLTTFRR